jgi:hypothetical protein
MNAILRNALLVSGLAIATPALAWSAWPDIDFEWYANVGRPAPTAEVYPAPRAGYIWAPGRYEWTGAREVWLPGAWITDDYDLQWRTYAARPFELRDRDGNVIAIAADAYPVGSAR